MSYYNALPVQAHHKGEFYEQLDFPLVAHFGQLFKKTFKEAIDPNEFKRQADVLVGFAILKLS